MSRCHQDRCGDCERSHVLALSSCWSLSTFLIHDPLHLINEYNWLEICLRSFQIFISSSVRRKMSQRWSHFYQTYWVFNIPWICRCLPRLPSYSSVCQVSPLQTYFFLPFPVLYSLERSRYTQSTLKERGLFQLFGNLPQIRFVFYLY